MAKNYNPSAANRAAYEKLTEAPVSGVVPPQAVELEEAVLGALMLERDSTRLRPSSWRRLCWVR